VKCSRCATNRLSTRRGTKFAWEKPSATEQVFESHSCTFKVEVVTCSVKEQVGLLFGSFCAREVRTHAMRRQFLVGNRTQRCSFRAVPRGKARKHSVTEGVRSPAEARIWLSTCNDWLRWTRGRQPPPRSTPSTRKGFRNAKTVRTPEHDRLSSFVAR